MNHNSLFSCKYLQDAFWSLGFPSTSDGKASVCNAGDLGSIPGLGRSPGEAKGYPVQYSGLENSMDHTVHGVTKSGRNFSVLCLGFPSGSVGKESACKAGDLGLILGLGRFPWRREWLHSPVFWPGEFHGLYSLWGHKESDTTFTFNQLLGEAYAAT